MFPIYDKLGGKEAVLDIIERRMCWRPSPHTLKKWAANRRISPKAAVVLMAECEKFGVPVSVEDFTKPASATSSRAAGHSPSSG